MSYDILFLYFQGTPKWDGEKLVIEAIPEDDPSTPLCTIREMVGDEMVMVSIEGGRMGGF